jgi:hypothetical protein
MSSPFALSRVAKGVPEGMPGHPLLHLCPDHGRLDVVLHERAQPDRASAPGLQAGKDPVVRLVVGRLLLEPEKGSSQLRSDGNPPLRAFCFHLSYVLAHIATLEIDGKVVIIDVLPFQPRAAPMT